MYGSLTTTNPNQQDQPQQYLLSKLEISIGRAPSSDIVLHDNRASRSHARLTCSPDTCIITDLGSANGIKLNGRTVPRADLHPGDLLTIGSTIFRYDRDPNVSDDADLTCIDTEQQLEATLSSEPVVSRIGETNSPRIVIHTRTRTWDLPLDAESVTIGRLPVNDIVIDSPRASRRHARIERDGKGHLIRDLNSDNGTWIGGVKTSVHRLADGDTVNIGGARLIYNAAYQEEDLTVLESTRASTPRRTIVVIPGFFGSNLWLDGRRIWPNVRSLYKLPELIKYTEEKTSGVTVKGLVNEVVIIPNVLRQEQYGGLIDYLEQNLGYENGKDLFQFAYDFREDLRTTAKQLARSIDQWSSHGPVTIIAHSMGSLISRYYVDVLGGHRNVERLIMLGGPHQGSPKSIMLVAAEPSVLPFGLMGSRIQQVMLTFPAVYHLLPEQPCGLDQHGKPIDWLHDPTWLAQKYRPYLAAAASFRAEIAVRSRVPTLCIFGYGMKTQTSLRVQRDANGLCTRIDPTFELGGDGSVPETMATLKGSDIHPIRQYHGALHTDSDVKKRLKLELTR